MDQGGVQRNITKKRLIKAFLYRILISWGGRTRTYEWRLQRPLPYHLATPQKLTCYF